MGRASTLTHTPLHVRQLQLAPFREVGGHVLKSRAIIPSQVHPEQRIRDPAPERGFRVASRLCRVSSAVASTGGSAG
jgi:hypothetical protein